MPGQKQDRRVSTVASKPAGCLPVRLTADAIPRLVRHSMDTSDLVIRVQLGLILALEVLETQDQEVELIRVVPLQVADFTAEGDSLFSVSARVKRARGDVGQAKNPVYGCQYPETPLEACDSCMEQWGQDSPPGPAAVGIPVIETLPLMVSLPRFGIVLMVIQYVRAVPLAEILRDGGI